MKASSAFAAMPKPASDWFWETGPDHRVTQISEHSDTITAPAGAAQAYALGHCA